MGPSHLEGFQFSSSHVGDAAHLEDNIPCQPLPPTHPHHPQAGDTPLHTAITLADPAARAWAVRSLVAAGADCNLRDARGMTPLLHVAKRLHEARTEPPGLGFRVLGF